MYIYFYFFHSKVIVVAAVRILGNRAVQLRVSSQYMVNWIFENIMWIIYYHFKT